jgi:hypothetical protein
MASVQRINTKGQPKLPFFIFQPNRQPRRFCWRSRLLALARSLLRSITQVAPSPPSDG